MINNYAAPYPANADIRDVMTVSLANLPWVPQGQWTTADNTLHIGSDTNTLTGPQLTTWQGAVLTTTADPNAPYRTIPADISRLSGIPTILRNQAQIASSTTVTAGNAVAVLQTVVNDLAIFCARLADFIEGLGYGQ